EDFFFDEEEREDTAYQEQRHETMAMLFGTSAAGRMYKRLAIMFHPDREMDEAAKQDKHHLMVQLAQAKKNHDIWTILSLYQEHIDPNGGVEEKDLPAINQLLAEQVEILKIKYRQMEYSCDPLTSLIWSKFGKNSPQQSLDKKLAHHAKELQNSIEEERLTLVQLTSLKVLKQYLAERAEEDDYDMEFLTKLFQ
ncbi:MAG: hypothetical protein HYZ77_08055, partial [Serratia liquefaciens]|nr:hypothetical protein [Serratia liquefaciens]